MMDTIQTPLLATSGDPEGAKGAGTGGAGGGDASSTPLLSSGPAMVMHSEEEETSEFARLIGQPGNPPPDDGGMIDGYLWEAGMEGGRGGFAHGQKQRQRHVWIRRGTGLTAVATTLTTLHLGYIWGSFVAEEWLIMQLQIHVGWQKTYLPMLDGLTTLTESVDLASLFQLLGNANEYTLLVLLWITSLLLPCLFMILSPTWLIGDFNHSFLMEDRIRYVQSRQLVELMIRFAFLVVYVLLLAGIVSAVTWHWTDTTLYLRLEACNGFAAYVTGVTCALATMMVLRSPQAHPPPQSFFKNTTKRAATTTMPSTRSSRPQQKPDGQHHLVYDEEEHLLMMPLEDHPPPSVSKKTSTQPRDAAKQQPSQATPTSTPNRTADANRNTSAAVSARTRALVAAMTPQRSNPPSASVAAEGQSDLLTELMMLPPNDYSHLPPRQPTVFWQKVLVFEIAVITVLLWIPSMYMPAFRLHYSGFAAEFMSSSTTTQHVYMWQIPGLWFEQGRNGNTALWILIWIAGIFVVSTLLIPLAATCLALTTWMMAGDETTLSPSAWSRSWLFVLQPAMGGFIFSVALMGTIPYASKSLEAGTAVVMHQVCEAFMDSILPDASDCFQVTGTVSTGGWCYVILSLLLEIWVVLTLQWS